MENPPGVESISGEQKVNVIFEPKGEQAAQFVRNKEVGTGVEEKLNKNWRKRILSNTDYSILTGEFIEMLEELKDIWEGQLVRITTAEPRIELIDVEIRLIHDVSFRAGLMAKELEHGEINKMLQMNAIELEHTE